MGLGSRTARQHTSAASARTAGVDPSAYWDFKPGQAVMTVDGFSGKVEAVNDGPLSGTESYQVTLDGGLGGGEYTASQLTAKADAAQYTAANDYPELAEILVERPDIAPNSKWASLAKGAGHHPLGFEQCPVDTCGDMVDSDSGMGMRDHIAQHGEDPDDYEQAPHAAWEKRSSFRDGHGEHDHSRPKGEHGIESFDELEPNDGAEADVDEHGHLSWGGSAPACRDTDDYSMFGQNDAVEKAASYYTADELREAGRAEEQRQGKSAEEILRAQASDTGSWKDDYSPQELASPCLMNHLHDDHASESQTHTTGDHFDWRESQGQDEFGRPKMQPYDGHGAFSCNNRQCAEHPQSMYDEQPGLQGMPGWQQADSHPDKAIHREIGKALHESVDTNDARWLLDQNSEGPSKFSKHHKHHVHHHPLVMHPQARSMGWGYGGWGWPGCGGCAAGDTSTGDGGSMDGGSEASLTTRAAWSYTPHSNPIVHAAGTRPERPLHPGDTILYPSGHSETIHAVTDSLLNVGGTQFRHRKPTEGDHSESIWSSDTYDEAGQDVPKGDDAAMRYLDSNPHGPSKYSSFDPWSIVSTAAGDTDFRFEVTAAWSDVRSKAKRIRAEGGVHVTLATQGVVVAEVKGDHNIYETGIQRMPGRHAVQGWSCGCKWGAYHWGADDDFSRFAGRMCSHALALQYEAQSRGMFGRDVHVDDSKPSWTKRMVVVKHDIDGRRDVEAPSTKVGSLDTVVATLVRHVGRQPYDDVDLAFSSAGLDLKAAMRTVAAVNDAWGEPIPDPARYAPGPTKPNDPNENPASAGWASAPEPQGWGEAGPSGLTHMVSSRQDDDAIFEPEMGKEAFLPLVAPLVAEVAGAGAAGAAGVGAAEVAGAGAARAIVPKILEKAAPTLINQVVDKVGPQGPQGPQGPVGGPAPTGENPVDDDENNPLNYGARAELHDEPEGALPTTDGDARDPLDPSGLEPDNISLAATGSIEDIVAQFQATAGAQNLQAGSSGPAAASSDGMDIAAAARQFLETGDAPAMQTFALKAFTPAEQQRIINEGENVRAANLDRLDIAGTHYEPLEAALASADNDEEWMS